MCSVATPDGFGKPRGPPGRHMTNIETCLAHIGQMHFEPFALRPVEQVVFWFYIQQYVISSGVVSINAVVRSLALGLYPFLASLRFSCFRFVSRCRLRRLLCHLLYHLLCFAEGLCYLFLHFFEG